MTLVGLDKWSPDSRTASRQRTAVMPANPPPALQTLSPEPVPHLLDQLEVPLPSLITQGKVVTMRGLKPLGHPHFQGVQRCACSTTASGRLSSHSRICWICLQDHLVHRAARRSKPRCETSCRRAFNCASLSEELVLFISGLSWMELLGLDRDRLEQGTPRGNH